MVTSTQIKWLMVTSTQIEGKTLHGDIYPNKMAYLREKHFMVTSTQIKWLT